MNKYKATNAKDVKTLHFTAENMEKAITWTQNHADLSKEPWTVEEVKETEHQKRQQLVHDIRLKLHEATEHLCKLLDQGYTYPEAATDGHTEYLLSEAVAVARTLPNQ